MKKSALAEGIVLLGLAFAGIIEAIYIIYHKDPTTNAESVGPGHYVLCLAVPLLIAILSLMIKEYKKKSSTVGPGFKTKIDVNVVCIFLITAIYIYLIGVVGYLLSTIIFFIFAFKFSGVDNWIGNLIATFIISFCYYIIFIKLSALVFPTTSISLGF